MEVGAVVALLRLALAVPAAEATVQAAARMAARLAPRTQAVVAVAPISMVTTKAPETVEAAVPGW